MSVPYTILSSWLSVCQKIIKFGGDLTKFWQKTSWAIFWYTLYVLSSGICIFFWVLTIISVNRTIERLNDLRCFLFYTCFAQSCSVIRCCCFWFGLFAWRFYSVFRSYFVQIVCYNFNTAARARKSVIWIYLGKEANFFEKNDTKLTHTRVPISWSPTGRNLMHAVSFLPTI